jgi:predicted neutral ceramidase superfamily lipid hydrolase
MAQAPENNLTQVPLGQRLLDRPFLLLAAGLVVMFAFYTLWGLYEILSLPKATLP